MYTHLHTSPESSIDQNSAIHAVADSGTQSLRQPARTAWPLIGDRYAAPPPTPFRRRVPGSSSALRCRPVAPARSHCAAFARNHTVRSPSPLSPVRRRHPANPVSAPIALQAPFRSPSAGWASRAVFCALGCLSLPFSASGPSGSRRTVLSAPAGRSAFSVHHVHTRGRPTPHIRHVLLRHALRQLRGMHANSAPGHILVVILPESRIFALVELVRLVRDRLTQTGANCLANATGWPAANLWRAGQGASRLRCARQRLARSPGPPRSLLPAASRSEARLLLGACPISPPVCSSPEALPGLGTASPGKTAFSKSLLVASRVCVHAYTWHNPVPRPFRNRYHYSGAPAALSRSETP